MSTLISRTFEVLGVFSKRLLLISWLVFFRQQVRNFSTSPGPGGEIRKRKNKMINCLPVEGRSV